MKTRSYRNIRLLCLAFLCLSCNNVNNKSISNIGLSTKEVKAKTPDCKIRSKPKLFLNFWAGMTKDEYRCILDQTIKSSLLIEHSNNMFYILNSDSLKLDPYFEKDFLIKVDLTYREYSPSDNASEQQKYENSLKKFIKLKKELVKKYGKPYFENYNIFYSKTLGTFWKTAEKVIIFDLQRGILSYVDVKYMNKLNKNKMLKEKRIEQKRLDELKNL